MIHKKGNLTIVAEISCNHGGDLENAKRLIELAKVSGADAVKIQVYEEHEMVIDPTYTIAGTKWGNQNLQELYRKTRTEFKWVAPLYAHAHNVGIPIFCSVFSDNHIEGLENLRTPAYKIAAFEADHLQLLRRVHETGKQMFVSVSGIHSADDILALREFEDSKRREDKERLVVMHCTSSYPTERKEAKLDKILSLKNIFQIVGYSDHNKSMRTAEYAAVMGAEVIERHLSLGGNTEDEEFSLNPAQFKLYVNNIRRAKESTNLFVAASNEEIYKQFKRAVYATANIKEGARIRSYNSGVYRPFPIQTGVIAASEYPQFLREQFVAARDIKQGEIITWEKVK